VPLRYSDTMKHSRRNRRSSLFQALSCLLLVVCAAQAAHAKPWWLRGAPGAESDFLPPDVAFRVGAHVDGDQIVVRWLIADGYYLYRNKIEIQAESPDLAIGSAELPRGSQQSDPYFGVQEIYQQQVEARVHYRRADYGAHPLQVKVRYQGCAHAGLCYPPITKVLFPDTGADASLTPASRHAPTHWELAAMLGGGGAFLLAGLLLRKNRRLATPAA